MMEAAPASARNTQLGDIPTSVEQALQPSSESRIITEPNEPFRIVHVNEAWCHTCGFDAEEVLGKTCSFMHGPGTCSTTLKMLKQALQLKRNIAVQLLNYSKSGRPFMNTLQVGPLYNMQGQVTHYLGVVMARFLDGGGPVSHATQNGSFPVSINRPISEGTPAPQHPATVGGGGAASLQHAEEASHMDRAAAQHLDPREEWPPRTRRKGGGSDDGMCSSNGGGETVGGVNFDTCDDVVPMHMDDDEAGGSRVPPFLTKLTEILTIEDPRFIRLNPDTPSFTIVDAAQFAKEVLPRYFKHNKLGSFSQQLHTYGFRRVGIVTSSDSAIEFCHDQFSGDPAEFVEWIRNGGAISKRAAEMRECSSAPPPELLHDMLQVHEGMRQLALLFQQVKATHDVQLRTILQQFTARGILAPESASYISALPPNAPSTLQSFPGGIPAAARSDAAASFSSALGDTAGSTLGLGPLVPAPASADLSSASLSLSGGLSASATLSGGGLGGAANLSASLPMPSSMPSGGLSGSLPGVLLSRSPASDLGCGPSSDLAAASVSAASLQAQLDALEAGLPPLSGQGPADRAGLRNGSLDSIASSVARAVGNNGGSNSRTSPLSGSQNGGDGTDEQQIDLHGSVDLHGDEALQFFAETRTFGSGTYPEAAASAVASYDARQPPYPVNAAAQGGMEGSEGGCQMQSLCPPMSCA